jgi:hypothetical protein
MALEITLLGVLFLGGFVGFILGLALSFSKKLTYKAVAAVLGAALGGAPLAFMGNLAYERWMYPVGLVLGLISIRLLTARKDLLYAIHALQDKGDSRVQRVHLAIAVIDMIAIAFIILVVITGAAFFARRAGTAT